MTLRELRNKVNDWLAVDKLRLLVPDFIRFGQKSLERHLRLSVMRYHPVTASLSAGVNKLALPSDYIEMISLCLIEGTARYPITERLSDGAMVDEYRNTVADVTTTGRPIAFRRVVLLETGVYNNYLQFDRYTDKVYSYEMVYYRHLITLDDDADTNWWLTNAEDVLLYAALLEAAPLLPPDDGRIQGWIQMHGKKVDELKGMDCREKLGGTRKRVRYQNG